MIQDVDISTIATDRHTRHTGVASLMKTDYPHIDHQYDAISVTKKLGKKPKAKHCGQLFPFIQSNSKHLWWSVQTCNGDVELLVEKWKSIVHHVSNVHEWNNDPNALLPKCVHPTVSPEDELSKKWPRSGSVAHNALRKVVLQNTLSRDIKN